MSEPAMHDADFVNITVKFSSDCDADRTIKIFDTALIPFLTQLGLDDDTLYPVRIVDTDPAIEAKVMAVFEAESAAIEAERKAGIRPRAKLPPPPAAPSGLLTPAEAARKPTLAKIAKQASKAGIEVARYEVKPDGTYVVVTGKPEPAESEDPWLADLRTKETKQ